MLLNVFEWIEQVVRDHRTKKSSSSGSGHLATTPTVVTLHGD